MSRFLIEQAEYNQKAETRRNEVKYIDTIIYADEVAFAEEMQILETMESRVCLGDTIPGRHHESTTELDCNDEPVLRILLQAAKHRAERAFDRDLWLKAVR